MHSSDDGRPDSVTAMLRKDVIELAKRVAKYSATLGLLFGLGVSFMSWLLDPSTTNWPLVIRHLVVSVAIVTYSSYRSDPPGLTQMDLSRP